MRAGAPAIAFAGQRIDRADAVRNDPAQLAELLAGDALLLELDGLLPRLDAGGHLLWRPVAEAPAGAELVFLGLLEGRARFAAVPGEGDGEPATGRADILTAMALLPADELALYGGARSVLDWHARHRFCARCGHGTVPAKGGWQRDCPQCGAHHFPRVDPVVIMLVEHGGRLLLGRQARFPAGRYSALAGFVEPGESVEEAVAREVLEEAGVRVGAVRYLFSQPWPFPSQLMLACVAQAEGDALRIDPAELEDARWFTRAEVAGALADGDASTSFVPPPAQAVAHTMLRWWLEEQA